MSPGKQKKKSSWQKRKKWSEAKTVEAYHIFFSSHFFRKLSKLDDTQQL